MLEYGRNELGYIDMTLHIEEVGPLGGDDTFYERGRVVKNVNDNSTVYEK